MVKSLIDRTLDQLRKRRKAISEGKINSLSSPFHRYKDYLTGVEQDTYYIVTGYSGGGKSQFSYFFFVFEPILYLYYNRAKYPNLKYTIFCMPLEETPERITQRFISYLLFKNYNGKYLISPKNLRSSDNDNPAPEEILDVIVSVEFRSILDFFESCINFVVDVTPNQFYEKVKAYCESVGTTHYKEVKVTKELGEEEVVQDFDYYVPDNDQEYIIALVDHISLLPYRGTLKEAIDTFSANMVKLRNRYHVSPVIIQQQSASNESLDAFKQERSKPERANLADSKYTGRDANIIISVYNPFGHNLKSYAGYDLTVLKSAARFIELLKNRDGPENLAIGLLFNGACAHFKELAKPLEAVRLAEDTNKAKEYEERSRNLIYIKEEKEGSINDLF